MATFQITGPDGKKYRVAGENPEGAMGALRKMLGSAPVQYAAPSSDLGFDPVERAKATLAKREAGLDREQPSDMARRHPFANLETSQPKSVMAGAADTATLGFGDEGAALLGSALTGTPYEQALEEIRAKDTAAKEQNPKSYVAGQVGGGLAQAAATGGAGFLNNATSLGGRMLGSGLTGAAAGTIHGAGSGTDAKSRITNALIEGTTGGVVGAALPAVATGLGNLYRSGRDALARNLPGSLDALREVKRVIPDEQAALANIQAAGPNGMMADAGPNARAMLDLTIQRGGPGADTARAAVAERAKQAGTQMTSALDDVLGAPQGVKSAQSAIGDAAKPQVSAAYKAAYGSPIDYASEAGRKVEDIISRIPNRIKAQAVNRAKELMAYDGDPAAQILADVAENGAVTFREMPNVLQADYIKRALDQIVQDGTDGVTGKLSSDAGFARRIARDLRNAVSDAVPAYREALETAADPLSQQEAVRFGSRLLSPGVLREDVSTFVDGLTKPERTAIAQGLRSNLDDVMANVERTVMDGDTSAREAIKAMKEMSGRANRAKVAMAIGDEQADQLFKQFDEAASGLELRAAVSENSKTAQRTMLDRGVRERSGGLMSTLKQGEPINAAKRVVQAITGETPERVAQREDALYAEIADLLTRPAGQVMPAVSQLGRRDMATELMRNRINQTFSAATIPTTSQTGTQVREWLLPRR